MNIVYCTLYNVHKVLYIVHQSNSKYNVQSTMAAVHCTLYSVQQPLLIVHCTYCDFGVHCSILYVHCTSCDNVQYNVQFTMYNHALFGQKMSKITHFLGKRMSKITHFFDPKNVENHAISSAQRRSLKSVPVQRKKMWYPVLQGPRGLQ